MESPRIAADEAWEGEVAPESAAAPEPAEERPSMLSRLASWRAPEPEPEMERDGKTEAPAPPEPAEEAPRQLHCDHFYCRAPPGPLGLAFKDSTRVVGGLLPPYTSVLCGTVYPGDELVSVNDCVVADDVLGVLAAQDDGTTDRTLAFARASGRRPEDYYVCYAPPGVRAGQRQRLRAGLRRAASRPDVGAARRRRGGRRARDRQRGPLLRARRRAPARPRGPDQ